MAQDLTAQHQAMARGIIAAGTQLVDAIYELQQYADMHSKLAADFVDADFAGIPGLQHLTAALLGTVVQNVAPSMMAALVDAADGGRNLQDLMQLRAG